MTTLPFSRRVPLLNMSLTGTEDRCAARWLMEEGKDAAYQTVAREKLHQTIAEQWHSPWVASFMGGRSSLFAIIRTLGLKAGDQIIVPAFTCQCVANAITFNGVELCFADIETDTFGLSAEAVKKSITSRTRAILIQYTFGIVCRDLAALLTLARQRNLWVIEDCAHATGGKWNGQLLGTLGDIAFFSSERSKIVNTIHGGWVITANPTLGERLMEIYHHSAEPDEDFITRLLHTLRHAWAELNEQPIPSRAIPVPQMQSAELAGLFTAQYSWRMAEPVAELLLLQLNRLDKILLRRRQGAAFWHNWSQEQGLAQPLTIPGAQNTWLRYPILLSAEEKSNHTAIAERLNIETGVWFTTPVHPQKYELPHCPVGMDASRRCINLPTWLWNA